MNQAASAQESKKRYMYKNQRLCQMVSKIKLWPSRTGILHGVKTIENTGKTLTITTHCGESFVVWDSKNSRSIRWLQNRWHKKPCKKCRIPQWKLEKYSNTVFSNTRR